MKIWMRVGATLYLNDKEAELLLNGDNDEAKDLLKRMIYDNRFRLDGESYIPESAIQISMKSTTNTIKKMNMNTSFRSL